MFNVEAFTHAFITLLAVVIAGIAVFTAIWHQWWPLRLVAAVIAIASLAVVYGLLA